MRAKLAAKRPANSKRFDWESSMESIMDERESTMGFNQPESSPNNAKANLADCEKYSDSMAFSIRNAPNWR